MKTLGDQAKAFRGAKGWTTRQLAEAVGTSRQNIESLEASGNRIPKYLGKLADVMDTTVDDMLAQAGLGPKRLKPAKATPAPPSGPLVERLREEREADPYDLIERGLKALVIVGEAKEDVMKLVKKYAHISAETQKAVREQIDPARRTVNK
jgi:transcriptional regulator with XRE-family HTH domain